MPPPCPRKGCLFKWMYLSNLKGGYETPCKRGYERVRVRNYWLPKHRVPVYIGSLLLQSYFISCIRLTSKSLLTIAYYLRLNIDFI